MARILRLGIGIGWLSACHNVQCCGYKDVKLTLKYK